MNIFTTTAIAAAFLAASAATTMAAEMSSADCEAWFTKADASNDGALGGAESEIYIEKMTKTDIKIEDSHIIDKVQFLMECQKGTFEGLQAK
jgi:hypothetical protein